MKNEITKLHSYYIQLPKSQPPTTERKCINSELEKFIGV